MSGEPFQCGYGAIVREDVQVLEECLERLIYGEHPKIRVLEIGMHDGGTAKGIERFITNVPHIGEAGLILKDLEYWGIDPDPGTSRPRYVPEGGKVIIGDSAEVFDQIPHELDLVWVDGCHCVNHVLLDTLHYTPRVRSGGFICFHDINPAGQNAKEHQYHGPNTDAFGLAVTSALEAICFPWAPWTLFDEKYPSDRANCGTRAYRKGW